jgi:uncharacterized protein YjiS (DUF1127 family)
MSTFELLQAERIATPSRARRHTILQTVAATWRLWRKRQIARRELATLDAHLLRDIGIPREVIEFEIRQPPWRPLRDWRELRGGRGDPALRGQ